MRLLGLAVGLACAPLAVAQEGSDQTGPSAEEAPTGTVDDGAADADVDLAITVYDDLFARWDGTRWFVATEVVLPWETVFRARENYEFRSNRYQVRTIIACEKDWRRNRRKWEVDCTIEAFGMQATARRSDDPARVQDILDEFDAALTGSYLELQVKDNGRVTNIDLEGTSKRNSRETAIHESLRQIMSRVIVGYDMKLRRYNDLTDGVWVEYNSQLMTLPNSTNSSGNSTLVHKLQRVDGIPTVESRGRGLVATSNQSESATNYFEMEYAGVAVYDELEGFMTERVWALTGYPTSSSQIAVGRRGNPYHHAGRLRILDDEDDVPDVGPTRQVAPPGIEHPVLPPWMPLE